MKILALLTLFAAIAAASVVKLPIYKHVLSTMTLAQRKLMDKSASPKFHHLNKPALSKLHHPNKQVSSTLRRQRLSKEPLTDYWDGLYLANISLGTPPQYFQVFVDTGYYNLVVVDSSCDYADECNGDPDQDPVYQRHKYQRNASSTFKDDGSEALRYDTDGLNYEGTWVYDNFQISGLVAKQQIFAAASSISYLMNALPLDGVLGLGRPEPGVEDDAAVLHKLLPQLDNQVFTVYLGEQAKSPADKTGGQITFGAVDTENCGAPAVFAPLISEYYWKFTLGGYALGKLKSTKPYRAIVASGVSVIEGPLDEIDQIYTQINAQYDPKESTYTVACDTVKNIGDLVFTIGGVDLSVPATQFIMEVDDGTCGLWLTDTQEEDYDWRLGGPFIQEWCNIHDVGGSQIGFAKARHISV